MSYSSTGFVPFSSLTRVNIFFSSFVNLLYIKIRYSYNLFFGQFLTAPYFICHKTPISLRMNTYLLVSILKLYVVGFDKSLEKQYSIESIMNFFVSIYCRMFLNHISDLFINFCLITDTISLRSDLLVWMNKYNRYIVSAKFL